MFKASLTSAGLAAVLLTGCVAAPEPVPEALEPVGPGRLVIIGGGLQAGQGDVYRAFIDQRRGDGPILIVPIASAEPLRAASRTTAALRAQGVPYELVSTLPLAAVDDPKTEEDEALWADNADDSALVSVIETASAIWFTGGNQSRITDVLMDADGEDTPVLQAIRSAHASGTVIGGSSAGAAMMSPTMIVSGRSLPSIYPSEAEDHEITLAPGLGFFAHGVIDQHFGQRARLGRLIAALFDERINPALGFGVDENTAFVVDADGRATVAGTGYVTLVDARRAVRTETEQAIFVEGLSISLLSQGDVIDVRSLTITPAPYKSTTIGSEYSQVPRAQSAGVSSPLETMASIIGQGLVDTSGVVNTSRVGLAEDGRGVRYTFRQTETSRGYWGRAPDGGGRYTVERIEMSVEPVRVLIEPLEP